MVPPPDPHRGPWSACRRRLLELFPKFSQLIKSEGQRRSIEGAGAGGGHVTIKVNVNVNVLGGPKNQPVGADGLFTVGGTRQEPSLHKAKLQCRPRALDAGLQYWPGVFATACMISPTDSCRVCRSPLQASNGTRVVLSAGFLSLSLSPLEVPCLGRVYLRPSCELPSLCTGGLSSRIPRSQCFGRSTRSPNCTRGKQRCMETRRVQIRSE